MLTQTWIFILGFDISWHDQLCWCWLKHKIKMIHCLKRFILLCLTVPSYSTWMDRLHFCYFEVYRNPFCMRVLIKMFSNLKLELLSSTVGAWLWYSNAMVWDGHWRHAVKACLLWAKGYHPRWGRCWSRDPEEHPALPNQELCVRKDGP